MQAEKDAVTQGPAEDDGAHPRADVGRGEPIRRRVEAVLESTLDQPLAPGLYLVSTPIGNLADLSLRAIAVLARADLVYCEDTRHTRKLTSHFGIKSDMRSYGEHNAAQERPNILSRLRDGARIALVSDAGTPLISDPGFKLVREARALGLEVFGVPGPTAAIAALVTSGLPTDQFTFVGFLPPKCAARKRRLAELSDAPGTLIFYEAPQRLGDALADMAAVLGDRNAAIAKELTKLHERVTTGSLSELAQSVGPDVPKGEFVVLVAPAPAEETDEEALAIELAALLAAHSLRDAVRIVTEATGAPRGRVYQIALRLARESAER